MFKGVEISMQKKKKKKKKNQRNLKLTWMYLILSPKYKLDDNIKQIFMHLNFLFGNCKLIAAVAYNLQRISKM